MRHGMNRICVLIMAAAALCGAPAHADDGAAAPSDPPRWYAAVSGSLVYLDKIRIEPITYKWNSYDFGYGYALAAGYRVFPDVRWELEVEGSESSVKHTWIGPPPPGYYWRPEESTAIMTNAYYDFHNASQFVPYVGAGIGDRKSVV